MEMHDSPPTVPESSPSQVMFVEKVDSDTLERETVNHNITGLVPSPNWLTGLDSMDVCRTKSITGQQNQEVW